MSFLQIACIKTLSFLRCKEITSGGFLIELLPVSKTVCDKSHVQGIVLLEKLLYEVLYLKLEPN